MKSRGWFVAGGVALIYVLAMIANNQGAVEPNAGARSEFVSPSATTTPDVNVTRAQWDAVAQVIRSANVTVEPFDPSAPWAMRIVVSGAVAREITEYDARKLATMARERLGDDAVVTVKDDAGRRLARASAFKVQGGE